MNSYLLLILFTLLIINPRAAGLEATVCLECEVKAAEAERNVSGFKDLASKASKDFAEKTFLEPEVIEAMDGRELAELMVSRLKRICDSKRDPEQKPMPEGFSDIIMLVPKDRLSALVKFGFKNQHQVGTTKGCDCKETRLLHEDAHMMMGLPYTNATRELLPKYALQVFNDPKSLGQNVLPLQYGTVLFKFKPAVQKRATWTTQDSLSIDIQNGPTRTHEVRPAKDATCEKGGLGNYCEAQIWGDLDLTDVDTVYVAEGEEIGPEVKALNLPVRTYKGKVFNWADYSPLSPKETDKTSINDFSLGSETLFKPVQPPSKPSVLSMNRKEIETEIGKAASPIEKNLLNNYRYKSLSNAELVSQFKNYDSSNDKPKPSKWSIENGTGLYDITSSPLHVLSELSGRKRDETTQAFLLEQATHGKSDQVKALAYSGLTTLSWDKLKPLTLDALKDTSTLLGRSALFVAMKHLDDLDIKQAVNASDLGQLLSKRFSGQLCTSDQ